MEQKKLKAIRLVHQCSKPLIPKKDFIGFTPLFLL